MKARRVVWTCLLEVAPAEAEEGGISGAYVNAYYYGGSAMEAQIAIVSALQSLGFEPVSDEGIHEFRRLPSASRRAKRLRGISRRARRTGRVAFSSFHSWSGTEEE